MPLKQIYTAKDIADRLDISTKLFWYRQNRGIYPKYRKKGHYWVFTEEEVGKILRGQTKEVSP